MLSIDSSNYPSFRDYEKFISEKCEVYFDKKKLYKRLIEMQAKKDTYEHLIVEHMYVNSGGSCTTLNRDSVYRYLTDYENVYDKKLQIYDKNIGDYKISLDRSKVLKPLYDGGEAVDFLELYMTHSELKSAVSRTRKMYERFKDYEGDDNLGVLSYKYGQKSTGRYYTRDYNIQGINKDFTDCLTAPKGYFLYWCDFDQIDLRVAYETLLNEGGKFDKIFKEYDDKYEAVSRIMALASNQVFDLDKFKEERKKYKVGVLARCYGEKLNLLMQNTGDKEFARNLDNYFKNNTRYTDYLADINKALNRNDVITIRDYFGFKRDISNRGNKGTIINQCLNTPVQSTSNCIVMHFVNSVLNKFRSMGFGSDMIRVYMIKHDELVLIMHDDMKKYLNLLKDMSTIAVDDWSLLTMNTEAGKYYSLSEDVYDKFINSPVELTERSVFKHKNYKPIPEDVKLRVYCEKDKAIIVNDNNYNQVFDFVVKGDTVFGIKRFIEDLADKLSWYNVSVVIESSNMPWFDVTNNNTNFSYTVDNVNVRLKSMWERFYSRVG